ncbi:class I SAM-dependent methyltransferase [bacterium]|nr:class I SAM-dependent methyltransferase [bacterium]MBP9811243.1 class I SAM-dependent methyltransferase [bacterium]
MDEKQHWEKVYEAKAADAVSWYQPHLEKSLQFILKAAPSRSTQIIDVGAGESTLVDDLINAGYNNTSVLDISEKAIEVCKTRLGDRSSSVTWLAANILQAELPEKFFHVWHDRAVFHFLTSEAQRIDYVRQVSKSVKAGGHVIVATFGPQGPEKCSGLTTMRYDTDSLHNQFGARFRLVESATELHTTPFGTTQQFLYCFCKLEN